jgi:hypothetical protein
MHCPGYRLALRIREKSGSLACFSARLGLLPQDGRRTANGEQFTAIVALVAADAPSVDFCGYWQRSRAA